MRIFRGYVGFIAILVLVILVAGCLDNGDDSGNVTMLNKTANGTYSAAGVSFKCPDNWAVDMINENGNITIVAVPIHELNTSETKTIGPFKFEGISTTLSSTDPQFEVHILPNKGKSEQEAINEIKNEYIALGNKISSEKTTIDDEKAYKDVMLFNDTDERFEYIYFVKNGKTYLITFSTLDKDFDKEKANFDMILNSFKVQ